MQEADGIWKAVVPNTLFGGWNPYAELIGGDWYDDFHHRHHLGEVFLDGEALCETEERPTDAGSFTWSCAAKAETTEFYAAFRGNDPNQALVEISVRAHCFWPEATGVDYITVSGLTMRQTATQWAPPTAFQPGTIGPHWSRGWVIEHNCIHDSKCCGISLGKRAAASDNAMTKNAAKDGGQTYTETIFEELRGGWNGQTVGGHLVRDNEIYNCGQAGIVGNMGCAFSTVTGNSIHHINTRGEFGGAEIAAIKFHCGIDVQITGNCLCHSTRGLWLDWQGQGARVSRNVFFDNEDMDMFIEVCHGPCMVDHNLFLSQRNVLNLSEGTAFAHNLFTGRLDAQPDSRFTPYHFPHETAVMGLMRIHGGDDRLYNNLFAAVDENALCGVSDYEKYVAPVGADGPHDWGWAMPHPVALEGNAYLRDASRCSGDKGACLLPAFVPVIRVTETREVLYLETNLENCPLGGDTALVTSDRLGKTFQASARYETPRGEPIALDTDFLDAARDSVHPHPGPFETYTARIPVYTFPEISD